MSEWDPKVAEKVFAWKPPAPQVQTPRVRAVGDDADTLARVRMSARNPTREHISELEQENYLLRERCKAADAKVARLEDVIRRGSGGR